MFSENLNKKVLWTKICREALWISIVSYVMFFTLYLNVSIIFLFRCHSHLSFVLLNICIYLVFNINTLWKIIKLKRIPTISNVDTLWKILWNLSLDATNKYGFLQLFHRSKVTLHNVQHNITAQFKYLENTLLSIFIWRSNKFIP